MTIEHVKNIYRFSQENEVLFLEDKLEQENDI
jgi:hypothetical protein